MIRTLLAVLALLLTPALACADPSVTPVMIWDFVNHAPQGTAANPIVTSGGTGQGSTTTGQTGMLDMGAVTTAPPAYTTAQTRPVSLTTSGALRIQLVDSLVPVDIQSVALNVDAHGAAFFGLNMAAYHLVYNGTSWDNGRGNTTGTAIIEGGLPASHIRYAAAASGLVNTTTAVTAHTAAGAGVRNCISNVQIAHDTLGAVTEFALRDGAAGTVMWRTRLQTTASEGATYNITPAICGTANTLVEFTTLTAVTGPVYYNDQGYVSP